MDSQDLSSCLDAKAEAVTVIMATLGTTDRAEGLHRAIRSVREGNRSPVEILVVVNGQRYDEGLVGELSSGPRCEVVHRDQASLPKALLHGVRASTTPFFSFLDDDDEYLPGALDLRLAVLREHPQAAVLATNGYRGSTGDSLALGNLGRVEADPLRALFEENWLPSCGGLFRREKVPNGAFKDVPALLEWTWIAFQVASAGAKVVVLDEPTFRINVSDTSASRSSAYRLALPESLQRIRGQTGRPDIRTAVTQRLVQALYAASNHSLRHGSYWDAWRFHLRCLRYPEGWRYWKQTARLFGLKRPTETRRVL